MSSVSVSSRRKGAWLRKDRLAPRADAFHSSMLRSYIYFSFVRPWLVVWLLRCLFRLSLDSFLHSVSMRLSISSQPTASPHHGGCVSILVCRLRLSGHRCAAAASAHQERKLPLVAGETCDFRSATGAPTLIDGPLTSQVCG
jgi:hypothetical protein